MMAVETHGEVVAAPNAGTAHTETSGQSHGGAHGDSWLGLDATGWVSMAMLLLFAIMVWKKVPQAIGRALDVQVAKIRANLDEAQRLRAEAEALLADYQRRQAQAAKDADDIVANAHAEAKTIVTTAKAQAEATMARRTRMAEDRIAAAERAAMQDLRAHAAAIAAEAAKQLIRDTNTGAVQTKLTDQAIREIDRLN